MSTTKRTAQELVDRETARLIRRHLLIPAGLVGFIAACAVAIPVSVFVPKASQAKNCEAISSLVGLGQKRLDKEAQETREFEQKSHHNRFGLSKKDYDALVQKARNEATERQVVLDKLQSRSC